jgi:hypothetical protein
MAIPYYDRDRRRRVPGTGADDFSTPTAAPTMNHPYSNVGNATEYMASGYPFICSIAVDGASHDNDATPAVSTALADGDIISIAFPYVTRWIMLRGYNGASEVANGIVFVSFSETGVGTTAAAGPCQADLAFLDGTRLEVKCSKLYFRCATVASCDYIQVVAGLTNVPAEDFVVETSGNTNIGVDKTAIIIQELNA